MHQYHFTSILREEPARRSSRLSERRPPTGANDWPGLTDSCALPLVCTCWLVGWLPLRVAVVARSRGRRSSAVVSTTPPSLARLTAGGPCDGGVGTRPRACAVAYF